LGADADATIQPDAKRPARQISAPAESRNNNRDGNVSTSSSGSSSSGDEDENQDENEDEAPGVLESDSKLRPIKNKVKVTEGRKITFSLRAPLTLRVRIMGVLSSTR
jgi:hypothetical protein